MARRQAQPLVVWLRRQEAVAMAELFAAISATHLIKRRPGFAQNITPAPGSVLASPLDADWDPEPDYFFHWLRDAALAMEAVRLALDTPVYARLGSWELEQYVAFSQRLAQLDGAARLAEGPPCRGVAAGFLQYLRQPDELRRVRGDAARGDVRFNADGGLDITRWSRPQYDGVALRALGLLRIPGRREAPEWSALIAGDLDCVARNAGRACVDLWEEEEGFHCHTMLVEYAALRAGVAWAAVAWAKAGDARRAQLWDAAADELWMKLAQLRRSDEGWIASRMAGPGGAAVCEDKLLDSSVILGVLHAGLVSGPFSIADPLVHQTLLRLEAHYGAAFGLNRGRPADCAPHLGRNPADVYFGGGAWPLITLAAAELRYRLAATLADGQAAAIHPGLWFGEEQLATTADAVAQLVRAGDMGLRAVQLVTPADGSMAEQADRDSGAPRSARRLTWSYAALIGAAHARRQAVEHLEAHRRREKPAVKMV